MTRAKLFPILLAAGCVIAGLYGAIHDQISYSVSPEYFDAFKFIQFSIPWTLWNRVGAALVGWSATWWMGLIIGVPVLLVARLLPTTRAYVRESLIAFAVVALTALAIGLGALAVARATITAENVRSFWYPATLRDPAAFAQVGMMHNFGYLGGLVGIFTGSAYLIVRAGQLERRPNAVAPPGG
jgi:hypothetical protein